MKSVKRIRQAREIGLIAGVLAVLLGTWNIDWRASVILAGVLLSAASFYGMKRDA